MFVVKLHQACCLHQVASSMLSSSSCIKHVVFINLHQVRENKTSCNFILADFVQVVETTCIKFVDKKSCQLSSSLLKNFNRVAVSGISSWATQQCNMSPVFIYAIDGKNNGGKASSAFLLPRKGH